MRRLAASLVLLFASICPPLHAEAIAPQKVALQKRAAGTFYVNGAITGFGELEMLVDTGSSHLVIGEPVLKKLEAAGHARFSHKLGGPTADGRHHVVPVYRISGLRLGASCWVHDVEAAVIPGQSRAIVGMNVLSRLAPFTFSAEPADLLLHQCQAGSVVAADKAAVEP